MNSTLLTTRDSAREQITLDPPSPITAREAFSRLRTPMVAKTALLVWLGAHFAGAGMSWRAVEAALLASVLWLCLYVLNEVWDLILEQGHSASKLWTAGLVVAVVAVLGLSARFSLQLSALLFLMTLTQLAYSLPMIRGKRSWWVVVLLSGVINPLLRVECGAILGQPVLPWLIYFTVVMLHVNGALRTRLLRKTRDLQLGYTTVPESFRFVGMAAAGLGVLGLVLMCVTGLFPKPFYPLTAMTAIFLGYVWSGKVQDISSLRKAWLLCAPLALAVPFLLRH